MSTAGRGGSEPHAPPPVPGKSLWRSGRAAGAACLAIGVASLLADGVALVVMGGYWVLPFLLGPPVAFAGVALLLLPTRWTGAAPSAQAFVLARLVLGLALLSGFAVCAVLALDPVASLKWLGLT